MPAIPRSEMRKRAAARAERKKIPPDVTLLKKLGGGKTPKGVVFKTSCGVGFVVDAEDADFVAARNWQLYAKQTGPYVGTVVGSRKTKNKRQALLHRLLLNAPKGLDVDHIDRNPLNNTRANLRLATRSQNLHNSKLRTDNTSGTKGVSYNRHWGKWVATLRVKYKVVYTAAFDTLEEAVVAITTARKRFHKEFARDA